MLNTFDAILFRNSLLEELPRNFLNNLIKAAVQAAQGPMKVCSRKSAIFITFNISRIFFYLEVRCNGIRALGIFVKIMPDIPSPGSDTAILLDQAISVIAKQATTGNFMKVLTIALALPICFS